MNQERGLVETIFMVIICVALVSLMLWEFIIEGLITKTNCAAVICFCTCWIILFCAETQIEFCVIGNHILIKGLKYKIFLLLEKNKDSLYEFQEYCTAKRKKAIIQRLAEIQSFCDGNYDEDECLKRYDNDDEEYFYALLKNKKIQGKHIYKSDIAAAFDSKGLPYHYNQFKNYYTGQMLKTQNSVGGILLSAFSIILGVISLVSINAFALLDFKFWIFVISGLLVMIVDIALCWKSRLGQYAKRLNDDLAELNKDMNEFLTSKS